MSRSKTVGGIFLICGTSIGTGILGVPSITAHVGFFYSIILFLLCWFFSTCAALYYMEAHLWQTRLESNLLSMTHSFFGKGMQSLVWLVYLALLYSLMCTYLLAGSSWVIEAYQLLTGFSLFRLFGMLIFIGLIGLFIFSGIRAVDQVNRWMSFGLALTFCIILMGMLPLVDMTTMMDKPSDWQHMPFALPLLITAFGYSIIVPSLSAYFHKEALRLQKVILIGSVLVLLVYILWEMGTFGVIPFKGVHGLQAIASSRDNGTEVANALIYFIHTPGLSFCLTLFAMFAVITSFLGVSMALYHALSDGLKLSSTGKTGIGVLALTYIPPMIFLFVVPTGFSQILSWAGALVSLLMGILPLAMVWKGRYFLGYQGYRVWGGRPLLLFVGLFFLAVVVAEFTSLKGGV